jgi:integrase
MSRSPKPLPSGKPFLHRVPNKKLGCTYHYNSHTRESYGTDPAIAEARFADWEAKRVPGCPMGRPTLDDAIVAYYESDTFLKDIKPGTRALYRVYAEQLRASMGNAQLDTIDTEAVKALQKKLKDQPSKCYQTLAVLQTVFSHATGMRPKLFDGPNPVSGIKRVKSAPRTQIWTPEQIDALLAVLRPSLRLAALLLLYTAQRPSDVLAMTRGQVIERDGKLLITLRQQKTGTLVAVPVSRHLESALRDRLADPSGGLMLVPSPTGLLWLRRNFSRAWNIAQRKAGLPPLQRRDLRRTAVVNLALAGCTVPDIQSITGHHTSTIHDMLKTYLPQRVEVALGAMAKWDAAPRPKLDNVIQLAATAPKRRAGAGR